MAEVSTSEVGEILALLTSGPRYDVQNWRWENLQVELSLKYRNDESPRGFFGSRFDNDNK
jgi:hypothetical protein